MFIKKQEIMDIENLISKKICKYLLKGNTEQNEEIILYGLQLIVETVFKYCLLLLVAIIFNQGLACVIYIILLSGLRANAGGAHAKTNWGCTFILFISFAVGALLNQLEIPLVVSLAVCLMAVVICIKYAPASTQNNPITDCGMIKKKKCKSAMWLLICITIMAIGDYDGYVVSGVLSTAIAVVVQIKYK